MSSYVIEVAGGLHAFKMQEHWYCFLAALAEVVSTSKENVSMVLKRNESLLEGAPATLFASSKSLKSESEWKRLLETCKTVTAKLNPGGEYKRKKVQSPKNLTLYPLESAVRIVDIMPTWPMRMRRRPSTRSGPRSAHNRPRKKW